MDLQLYEPKLLHSFHTLIFGGFRGLCSYHNDEKWVVKDAKVTSGSTAISFVVAQNQQWEL